MELKVGEITLPVRKMFEVKNDRIQVFSSGMGTQSCGIAVMIYLGILPKPDLIVAADTGREASKAIEFNKKYIMPLMEEIGVPFIIPHKDSFPECGRLYDLIDDSPTSKSDVLLPTFIKDHGGIGKAKGFCSSKWKTQTVHRAVNKFFGKAVADKRGIDQWIGMSSDEMKRVKFPVGKWQKQYPLVEMMLDRAQVISISEQFGLPTPPRSSCYMCPNRGDAQWAELKRDDPEDFKKACDVEKYLHEEGYEEHFLHKSCKPLGEVIFITDSDDNDETNCSGICFT
ncbi:hypothetical protein VPAG_00044 [Vibrio phage douglas 12A4]|uniref:hypothetical protein n=1 Tax=Vibrio phage douglas 12A4 TaxID=573171 RepID=UPI0002C06111|nr:hypothetical protein VPAG_00044 [Vibrio phage douglas 12A4]AGG58080.1 hypothetical protein VPAG_00044 [Vibrio phage douglas 12A4]